jgi:hypothetical protein
MDDPGAEEFVSNYSWLVAPGDHLQADYTTPTRVKAWLQTKPIILDVANKQKAYGQWLAQLLQSQLGVQLVHLYYRSDQSQWPLTLRGDVIAALDEYFCQHTE